MMQEELSAQPDRGAVVPGLGGVRKARAANPGRGKGKRGGFRYLYLYLEIRRHNHLVDFLEQNEQEDDSEEKRRHMREAAEEIKRDAGDRQLLRRTRGKCTRSR